MCLHEAHVKAFLTKNEHLSDKLPRTTLVNARKRNYWKKPFLKNNNSQQNSNALDRRKSEESK